MHDLLRTKREVGHYVIKARNKSHRKAANALLIVHNFYLRRKIANLCGIADLRDMTIANSASP